MPVLLLHLVLHYGSNIMWERKTYIQRVMWAPELWEPWVQVLHALCVFQILVGETYVEGFYIRFRDVSGGSQQYKMVAPQAILLQTYGNSQNMSSFSFHSSSP